MQTHITLIEKIHQKLCNQLNTLDLLLESEQTNETRWRTLQVVRQLENSCRLEAELLAKLEHKLGNPHWVIPTVLQLAQRRLQTVLEALAEIKTMVRSRLAISHQPPAADLAHVLSDNARRIHRQIDITDTMVLRMLSILALPACSVQAGRSKSVTYLRLIED
jgi:hypothetical protein